MTATMTETTDTNWMTPGEIGRAIVKYNEFVEHRNEREIIAMVDYKEPLPDWTWRGHDFQAPCNEHAVWVTYPDGRIAALAVGAEWTAWKDTESLAEPWLLNPLPAVVVLGGCWLVEEEFHV